MGTGLQPVRPYEGGPERGDESVLEERPELWLALTEAVGAPVAEAQESVPAGWLRTFRKSGCRRDFHCRNEGSALDLLTYSLRYLEGPMQNGGP